MSADSLPEQRTEMPTDRRMGELRKEGHIHHSTELAQVLSLLMGFLLISYTYSSIVRHLKIVMVKSFEKIADTEPMTMGDMQDGLVKLILLLGPDLMLIVISVATVFALTVFLQTNWNIKAQWVKLNWSYLNPTNGIKRIFSIQGFVNVAKSIGKLCLILPIAFYGLKALAPQMVMLIHSSIPDIMNLTGSGIKSLFWKIFYVLGAMAIFDYAYGKWQWLRQNKMTKDEVKDERKAIEGDESTRRKIIAKGLQRISQRIRKSVPKADVVITNPTHYAIALKYDRERFAAPIVVAKGTDFLAAKIREIAKEHNIPILERKALARAIYSSTEVGKEIPRELFKAVAEVLAYVFKLKNPYRSTNNSSAGR